MKRNRTYPLLVAVVLFSLILLMNSCSSKSGDNTLKMLSEAESRFVNLSQTDTIKKVDQYTKMVENNPSAAKDYSDQVDRKRERLEELYDQVLRKLESGDTEGFSEEQLNKMKAK